MFFQPYIFVIKNPMLVVGNLIMQGREKEEERGREKRGKREKKEEEKCNFFTRLLKLHAR